MIERLLKTIQSALNRLTRNDINENFQTLLDNDIKLEDRMSNVISQAGNSNTEIVDARLDEDGTVHATLKARLDNKYQYGWDFTQNVRVRYFFTNGALNTQKKVNGTWVDY